MIQRGVVQDVHRRMHSPRLGVLGTIYQTPDARVHDGSGAHCARLNGHEQIAARQAMVPDGRPGLAQSHYFGMSRWIGIGEVAIESAANDFSFMDDDSANRNFARVHGALGRSQGLLHEKLVVFRTSTVLHEEYCMRMIEPALSALPQVD
jgi:hypothetical protein